jgi:hypothetical protein
MDYETHDYRVIIVDSVEPPKQLYGIQNKETGVIEYEDNILPRTLDACKNLQELHDAAIVDFHRPIPSEEKTIKVIGGTSKDESKPH